MIAFLRVALASSFMLVGCSSAHMPADAGTGPDAGFDGGTNMVSGTISLNGPLPGGSIIVALTTQPWSSTPDITASAMLSTGSALSYPYEITNFPDGEYYLTVVLTDVAGTTATPQTNWPVAGGPFSRTSNISLSEVVGRVYGNIDVTGASNVPVEIIIGTPTSADGAAGVVFGAANVQLGAADADGGVSHTTYDVFPLPDGDYQAVALFQLAGDSSFQTAYSNGHYLPMGTLPSADISGGSAVEIDFRGNL